jgi:hypothetical protein
METAKMPRAMTTSVKLKAAGGRRGMTGFRGAGVKGVTRREGGRRIGNLNFEIRLPEAKKGGLRIHQKLVLVTMPV